MSGHSKWSTIKRKKGLADQKRGAVFTKLGKMITIAAKQGGGDIDGNFQLRLAVDKAKSANMPKDNIERAIKRGIGELGGGDLHELSYEAFGPGGVGIIIKALSDNKNRTASEIKHILGKNNTGLGAQGSVMWQFHEKGVLRISRDLLDGKSISDDDVILTAIDAGAEDVDSGEEGLTVYTAKDEFERVKTALENLSLAFESSDIELIPENTIKLDDKDQEKLDKLLDSLESLDDVNETYHNAK